MSWFWKLLGLINTGWDVRERERQSWRWRGHFHHHSQCLCSSLGLCFKDSCFLRFGLLMFWLVGSRIYINKKLRWWVMTQTKRMFIVSFVFSGTYYCLHEWSRDCTIEKKKLCILNVHILLEIDINHSLATNLNPWSFPKLLLLSLFRSVDFHMIHTLGGQKGIYTCRSLPDLIKNH